MVSYGASNKQKYKTGSMVLIGYNTVCHYLCKYVQDTLQKHPPQKKKQNRQKKTLYTIFPINSFFYSFHHVHFYKTLKINAS